MLLEIMKGYPKQPRHQTKGVFLLYNGREPEGAGTAPSSRAGKIPAAGGGGKGTVPPRPAGPAWGDPTCIGPSRERPRLPSLATLGSCRKAFGILAAALEDKLIPTGRPGVRLTASISVWARCERAGSRQSLQPACQRSHAGEERRCLGSKPRASEATVRLAHEQAVARSHQPSSSDLPVHVARTPPAERSRGARPLPSCPTGAPQRPGGC